MTATAIVPVCQNCGSESWLKIQQKVYPFELLLMCFGCCKAIKYEDAMNNMAEVNGDCKRD